MIGRLVVFVMGVVEFEYKPSLEFGAPLSIMYDTDRPESGLSAASIVWVGCVCSCKQHDELARSTIFKTG